jgi:hypothetical protein
MKVKRVPLSKDISFTGPLATTAPSFFLHRNIIIPFMKRMTSRRTLKFKLSPFDSSIINTQDTKTSTKQWYAKADRSQSHRGESTQETIAYKRNCSSSLEGCWQEKRSCHGRCEEAPSLSSWHRCTL